MSPQRDECPVCGGDGNYPIIDVHGTERYLIRCPECFGHGTIEAIEKEEPEDWPPRSTAASIHTLDALRQAVKDWNKS